VRDPFGFFLFTRVFVSDIDDLLALDEINELFSLSLELRSIDTVRFVFTVVSSKKI